MFPILKNAQFQYKTLSLSLSLRCCYTRQIFIATCNATLTTALRDKLQNTCSTRAQPASQRYERSWEEARGYTRNFIGILCRNSSRQHRVGSWRKKLLHVTLLSYYAWHTQKSVTRELTLTWLRFVGARHVTLESLTPNICVESRLPEVSNVSPDKRTKSHISSKKIGFQLQYVW